MSFVYVRGFGGEGSACGSEADAIGEDRIKSADDPFQTIKFPAKLFLFTDI
jgi:hypothetical protein